MALRSVPHSAESSKRRFWMWIARKCIRLFLLGNAWFVLMRMAPGVVRDVAELGVTLVAYLSTTGVFRGDNEDLK